MTSPSANPRVSPSLMMSCKSNQRRVWAALQWATEGTQRVILSGAPHTHKQLCPCLLQSHIILSRRLNCLSALTGNKLHVITEPFTSLTVSLCWQSYVYWALRASDKRYDNVENVSIPSHHKAHLHHQQGLSCLCKHNSSSYKNNPIQTQQIQSWANIFFFLFFWLEVFVQHDTLSSKTVHFQRPFKCCFDKSMA